MPLLEDLADDGGHETFFAGVAFGDHEGDSNEGAIGDFEFAVGGKIILIESEEHDEEEGGDAFVAVEERVVFDDEI